MKKALFVSILICFLPTRASGVVSPMIRSALNTHSGQRMLAELVGIPKHKVALMGVGQRAILLSQELGKLEDPALARTIETALVKVSRGEEAMKAALTALENARKQGISAEDFLANTPETSSGRVLEVGDLAPSVVLEGVMRSTSKTASSIIQMGERREEGYTVLKFFNSFWAVGNFHNKVREALSDDALSRVQFNYVGLKPIIDVPEHKIWDYMELFPDMGANIFIDSQGKAKLSYGIKQIPTVYVIDNTTHLIAYKHVGHVPDKHIKQLINLLDLTDLSAF